MKPAQVAQVEFIKDCLRNGLKRASIMGKFGKKWESVSRTTFDRRLKEAEEAMQAELQSIKERTEEGIGEEVEARKAKLMTVLERQEVLTKIARGEITLNKYIVADGVIQEREVVPDYNERRSAIAELNKMDGSYAPAKTDVTTDGKAIMPQPIIIDWSETNAISISPDTETERGTPPASE